MRRRLGRFLGALALVAGAFAASGCGDHKTLVDVFVSDTTRTGGQQPTVVDTIPAGIQPAPLTFTLNLCSTPPLTTTQIIATVVNKSGVAQGVNQEVIFTSNKPQVATVSSTGVVTAVSGSASGTDAQIFVTSKGHPSVQAIVDVRVVGSCTTTPPTNVIITPHGPFNLQSGTQCTNTSVSATANQNVNWSSSNPAIATVNQSGTITAVPGASGSVYVKATAQTGGGTPDSVLVNVSNASCQAAQPGVVSVTVTPSTFTCLAGGTVNFTATVSAVNGAPTTVNWSAPSGNMSLTVSGNTAVGTCLSAGSATVQATSTFDATKFGQSTGTISALQNVVLSTPGPVNLSSCAGGTNSVTITSNVPVNVVSSNPNIATVTSSSSTTFVITAVSGANQNGVTITASPQSGTGTAATLTVNVSNAACQQQSTVTISVPTSMTCQVGQQITITPVVTVNPSTVSNAVTWTIVSGGNLATMTQSGNSAVLNCQGAGTVVLQVTSVAIPTVSVQVTVTITSVATCTFTSDIGQQADGSIILTLGQVAHLTGTCPNAQFPFWFSNHPEIVLISGSDGTFTDTSGQTYRVGFHASIQALARGTAVISAQASITNTSTIFSRTVTVQ